MTKSTGFAHAIQIRMQEDIARKQQRWTAITELIDGHQIKNVDQLVQHLLDRGLSTNSASVERDLQSLQVHKRHDDVYVLPDEAELAAKRRRLMEMLQASALDIGSEVKTLAIRTADGKSDQIAAAIEDTLEERVIGSLAVRDTVLVLVHDDAVGQAAIQEIQDLYR